jgi:hypothetical protein
MNTFKKTLIGASLLAVSASSYAGLGITVTAKDPSPQAVSTADFATSNTFVMEVAADYAAGDTIAFTFSQDVDSTQVFSTAAVSADANDCAGGVSKIGFGGYNNKVATYIFNAVDGSTVGCKFTIPAVKFDGAAIAAADTVTVSAATSRGFGTLESVPASATTELFDVSAAQFGLTITKLTGIVDVEDARQSFVDDSTNAVDDNDADNEASEVLTIQLTDTDKGASLLATSTVTVTGDMSWAKEVDANGDITYPGITVAGGTGAVITDTSVTYTEATASTATVTFNTAAMAADSTFSLPSDTYTVAANIAFNDEHSTPAPQSVALSGAGGAWTLNGASITAYGISNSPSVTPMLWIQNGGLSDGNITASVYCDGKTISVTGLGTASPRSNTKVGEAIQAAVDAAGTCPTVNTRYDATVTVNGPAKDITMNASYKVTAADGATDRVMLETSDSLPATSDAAN